MSLLSHKTFRVGVVASKGFDNSDYLEDQLGSQIDQIVHLYTNGVNRMVIEWAIAHGVSHTIYPATHGNSIIWANNRIIDNSDKVYILASPDSASAKMAEAECQKRGVKFEMVVHDSLEYWKERAKKAFEIEEMVNAIPKNDLEKNEELCHLVAAIRSVL